MCLGQRGLHFGLDGTPPVSGAVHAGLGREGRASGLGFSVFFGGLGLGGPRQYGEVRSGSSMLVFRLLRDWRSFLQVN